MIEYYPASLKRYTATRPRVFLIDFESAVEFPEDCPPENRRASQHFFPDFGRPLAPELAQNQENGASYDPFPLDIWQLGRRLVDYQVNPNYIPFCTAADNSVDSCRRDR